MLLWPKEFRQRVYASIALGVLFAGGGVAVGVFHDLHAKAATTPPGTGKYLGTPGTITSSDTITGGTNLYLNNGENASTDDPTTEGTSFQGGQYQFAAAQNANDDYVIAPIATAQGATNLPDYLHFQEIKDAQGQPVNTGGGFLFISPTNNGTAPSNDPLGSNLNAWIAALGGNENFVEYYDSSARAYPYLTYDWFQTTPPGQSSGYDSPPAIGETLDNLSNLVQQTGDAFVPQQDEDTKDQNDGFQVIMAHAPISARIGLEAAPPQDTDGIGVDAFTVNHQLTSPVPQGTPIFVFDQVTDGAWEQNTHLEWLNVTNSAGQSVNGAAFPQGELAAFQAADATDKGYTVSGPQAWYLSAHGLPASMIAVEGGGVGLPSDYGASLFDDAVINGIMPSDFENSYLNGQTRNPNHTVSGYSGNFPVNPGGGGTDNLAQGIELDTTHLTPGTYTITLYAADDVGNFATPVSQTFTIGQGVAAAPATIALSASPQSLSVGDPSTLQASVVGKVPTGYQIEIEDLGADGTLSGANASVSADNVSTYSTSATSYGNLTDTYQADIVSVQGGTVLGRSNDVTVTWGNPAPPPPPPSNYCGTPYDTNEYWTDNGTPGSQTFHWTYVVPTVFYRTVTTGTYPHITHRRIPYCVNEDTEYSAVYPVSEYHGHISGLAYDPGYPGHMFLPEPADRWDNPNNTFFGYNTQAAWNDLNVAHGWPGWQAEVGKAGPNDNQAVETFQLPDPADDGKLQTYHLYSNPYYPTPWAFIRPHGSFVFRFWYKGSPNAMPTGGRVQYTLVNPDGSTRTWYSTLLLSKKDSFSYGDRMRGLNEPPMPGYQLLYAGDGVAPKHTITANGTPELAKWSLSDSYSTVQADDAHVNVTITIDTPAGEVTYAVPDMATMFSYPTWYMYGLGLDEARQRQIAKAYATEEAKMGDTGSNP